MYSLDGMDGMLYFNTMNRNVNIAFYTRINSRYINELNTNTLPESKNTTMYFYTLLRMACMRPREKVSTQNTNARKKYMVRFEFKN